MIDIHSHILPGMDDGATSVEESLNMLRESKKNNIEIVIATSHCYPKCDDDIKVFLEKRQKSYELLKEAIKATGEDLPKIKLGCEVNLACDISKFDLLEELKIEGTDYMLIEMPYIQWSAELLDVLYSITLRNIIPIMAHIERFYTHLKHFDTLMDLDVFYQLNADSIIDIRGSGIIDYFFKNGMVQFLGSDMHNTTTRPTNLLKAWQRIEKVYGKECLDYFVANEKRLLENREIEQYSFKRKNILTRMF